ncbi:ribonuclease P protein component [Aerococcus mictus]
MKTDTEQQGLPWLPLMVMLGLVLLAIISELLPSGLLVQMGDDLGVDYGTVSYLVGGYALPAGLLAIPMTQVVTKFNRRPLLLVLTCGFALSNFLVFLAPNFPLAFMGRLIGGASAGTFWSMLGPYAMDMVSSENRGKAGTIALAGSPIGISLGLPLWTRLGQVAGWRIAFLATALAFAGLGLLAWRLLPSIPGQASDSRVKPTDVLKKPGFRVAILVVFLMVMAEYSVYVYIQLISERLGLALQSSQIFFGVGALLAVWIVARFIDSHLKHLMQGALLAGAIAMFVFLALSGHPLLGLGAMVVGLSVGKKIGNAVTRNRVKRLIRQALTELKPYIKSNVDFIIIARKPTKAMSQDQVKSSLIHVMRLQGLFHTDPSRPVERNERAESEN